MRHLSLALITALITACSTGHHVSKQPEQPVPIEVETEVKHVKKGAFSLSLPADWTVKPTGNVSNAFTKIDLVARSNERIGRTHALIVMTSTKLVDADDPSDNDFGAATALITTKTSSDKVLSATPMLIDGLPGATITSIGGAGLLVLQQAIAVNRVGYIIRCAGDAFSGRKLVNTCLLIFKTIHIKR